MTSQRRPRAWADIRVNQAVAAAAGSVPVDILVDLPENPRQTVVRLIGNLTAFPDDRNAAIDGAAQVDIGIGVAAQEAFTAQVVPDPNQQADYPSLGWLYISTRVVIFNNASGTTEKLFIPEFNFDIGANRKVDKGILYLVWNNETADATGFTVRLVGRVRALVLL